MTSGNKILDIISKARKECGWCDVEHSPNHLRRGSESVFYDITPGQECITVYKRVAGELRLKNHFTADDFDGISALSL